MGGRKAGVCTGNIETPALALPSEPRAFNKKQAECLAELVRLERKSQEMENAHTQALAAIQERHRAAQENFNAVQERHRAAMVKIAANQQPAAPAGDRSRKTNSKVIFIELDFAKFYSDTKENGRHPYRGCPLQKNFQRFLQ